MTAQRRIDPADVRRLAAAGMCARDIAATLGYGYSTVTDAARLHGIAVPRPVTRPRKRSLSPRVVPLGVTSPFWRAHTDALLALYETGMSASWIARKLSESTGARVSKNMVMGRLNTLGLCKPTPAPVLPIPRIEFPPERGCRFPLWGRGKPDFAFCGERTIEIGMPYCCEHHRITHKPTAPMKEAA